MSRERALCPSAPCRPGAALIGIVGADGSIGFLDEPLAVTPRLAASLAAHGEPERHVRCAAPCARHACRNWSGRQCDLPARVMADLAASEAAPLPTCAIRDGCTWFRADGPRICHACRFVVTNRPSS